MAKEKKQFRELSDEELKQVTGGLRKGCDNKPPCRSGFGEKNGCCYPNSSLTD